MLKPIDFVATLLEEKVKYQKLPSGNSEYIKFYDKNGEMSVLQYDGEEECDK